MDQPHSIDRVYHRIQIGFSITFFLWFGTLLLDLLAPTWDDAPTRQPLYLLFHMLAWAGVIFSLIRLLRLHQTIRVNRRLADTLNDEFTRANRQRAYQVAFWSMLLSQGALFSLSFFFLALRVEQVIAITFFVGSVSFLGTFLFLDRE